MLRFICIWFLFVVISEYSVESGTFLHSNGMKWSRLWKLVSLLSMNKNKFRVHKRTIFEDRAQGLVGRIAGAEPVS